MTAPTREELQLFAVLGRRCLDAAGRPYEEASAERQFVKVLRQRERRIFYEALKKAIDVTCLWCAHGHEPTDGWHRFDGIAQDRRCLARHIHTLLASHEATP